MLYDEDNDDPHGNRYVGSALWRTETVSPGPGLALPSDFPEGGINEQARGVPLLGLASKVTNNYFLIGLSEANRQRNVQLLKERDWFDVPIVYTSSKRAILAKGTPGARAFEQAFRAWGQ